MRRFQSTMVSLALAAGWPLAAHAEELIDPSTVGIAAQHRIGTVGWGLTAGSEGFGELSVGLEALQLRGTIGPAHRHFTTLGAVDGTLDFRDQGDWLRRFRLRGIDAVVLYGEDHIGYYVEHESEWGGTPERTSHRGEAGFAFHFLDDPSDPNTGYAALTFGIGVDSLEVGGEREAGVIVPVGLRVVTDPAASASFEGRAELLTRTYGAEGNHGGRIEAVGRLRVHRGHWSHVSIVTRYRAVLEPVRFGERDAEHLASAGMEGSF
jgi:hypothetical protein